LNNPRILSELSELMPTHSDGRVPVILGMRSIVRDFSDVIPAHCDGKVPSRLNWCEMCSSVRLPKLPHWVGRPPFACLVGGELYPPNGSPIRSLQPPLLLHAIDLPVMRHNIYNFTTQQCTNPFLLIFFLFKKKKKKKKNWIARHFAPVLSLLRLQLSWYLALNR
jgi:hypothetical protein